MPPMLVPSSLYKEEAKRDSTRIRIYNMVLQQIYNKVKAVARVPGNEKSHGVGGVRERFGVGLDR